MNLNIGFLISGELGYHCIEKIRYLTSPQFIFTDRKSIEIIDYAKSKKIPLYIGNPRNERTESFLNEFKTDLIFSINYLFIVNQDILMHPEITAINFHGSLLPRYRGRTPHVWAIINGEKETGISAHIMEDGCDTGDIVLQEVVQIEANTTGDDILQRYKIIYPSMIEKIVDSIENNKLVRVKQDNDKATYFGKRTPDDGRIDWNWKKERIINWVRAQAYPYPGAFTFLNGKKVIIDKIKSTEIHLDEMMPNGLIIEINPKVIVKTTDGLVELSIIRNRDQINFSKNNQLL